MGYLKGPDGKFRGSTRGGSSRQGLGGTFKNNFKGKGGPDWFEGTFSRQGGKIMFDPKLSRSDKKTWGSLKTQTSVVQARSIMRAQRKAGIYKPLGRKS